MEEFARFIEQKRRKLLAQKKRIDEQLRELDVAEKLLKASKSVPKEDAEGSDGAEPVEVDGTIKERVLGLLSANPYGLTAIQILTILQSHGMVALTRTSLSPQLSRLKSDGILEHEADTGLWKVSRT